MTQHTDHTPPTEQQLDEIAERLSEARLVAERADWMLQDYQVVRQQQADAAALLAEVRRLRDELAQEQKANDRLNAVTDLCDAAEKQATRWEHPLPVPEWVTVVRHAIDPAAPVAAVSSAAEDGGQP